MKLLLALIHLFSLGIGFSAWLQAQTLDTITTKNQKLEVGKITPIKHTYAVFFTDSTGKRTTSADIWDREIRIEKNTAGKDVYTFDWKVYRKDTLALHAQGQCLYPTLEFLEYSSTPSLFVKHEAGMLNIKRLTRAKTDTTFSLPFDGKAFAFPMDLEFFGLLPMKFIGQKFSIPFYEPGTQKYTYFTCSVVGKESLRLQENASIDCWLLQIDYGRADSYSTFWISASNREVLKMQEYFNGRFRYKVKLFTDNSSEAVRIPKK